MNFDLSDDQKMLKALAERFITDRYDLASRRSYQAEETGFSQENWSLLGELGLIAMPFSPESGGLGASETDLIVLFEALGRGLLVEPLAASVVLAGCLFERCADDAQKAAWMPGLVSGEKRLAFAHAERRARHNPAWVETRAVESGGMIRLEGEKIPVLAGLGADAYVVSARDASGIGLYLVPADATRLKATPYRLIDGSVATVLALDAVTLPRSARLSGGLGAIEEAYALTALATGAEALGIMEMLLAATLEYLRTRKQFGVAIGSFQVLQHRMVKQYIAVEQARSLLYLAALTDPADRLAKLKAIAGARAFSCEAAVNLSHEAIQLHGGMGVSDELIVGHAHKRIFALSRFPDDAGTALDRFAGVVNDPMADDQPGDHDRHESRRMAER